MRSDPPVVAGASVHDVTIIVYVSGWARREGELEATFAGAPVTLAIVTAPVHAELFDKILVRLWFYFTVFAPGGVLLDSGHPGHHDLVDRVGSPRLAAEVEDGVAVQQAAHLGLDNLQKPFAPRALVVRENGTLLQQLEERLPDLLERPHDEVPVGVRVLTGRRAVIGGTGHRLYGIPFRIACIRGEQAVVGPPAGADEENISQDVPVPGGASCMS